MHFLVNGGLAGYVLRTNRSTVHIVRSVHCELTDKLYEHQLHAQSLNLLQTNKIQHAAYRTGYNWDVCRTRNHLEGRQFVINNKFYYYFYKSL